MGLSQPLLKLILAAHNEYHFQGPALSLGCQDIYATYEELETYFRQVNTPFKPIPSKELKYTTSERLIKLIRRPDYVHEEVFFRMLGIDDQQSLDTSNRDGATIIHDLNKEIPADMRERFALVLDAGTIEHIFDVATVLRNIVNMISLNGIVIHFSPASNYINHGFYSFSPTLFYDFYSSNDFGNFSSYFLYIDKDDYLRTYQYLKYTHNPKQRIYVEDDGLILFFFLAQKIKSVSKVIIPQQRDYFARHSQD